MFPCTSCEKVFASKTLLNQHVSRNHSNKTFSCEICKKTFKRKDKLGQHIKAAHGHPDAKKVQTSSFKCELCNMEYMSKTNLNRHVNSKHLDQKSECTLCGKLFMGNQSRNRHEQFSCPKREDGPLVDYIEMDTPDIGLQTSSPQPGPSTAMDVDSVENLPSTSRDADPDSISSISMDEVSDVDERSSQPEEPKFKQTESGFKGRLQTWTLKRSVSRALTLLEFFVFIFDHVVDKIVDELKKHKSVKVNLFVECEFENIKGARCMRNFKTKNVPLTLTSDLGQFCSDSFEKILYEKECCEMVGSGWSFLRVKHFELRINKYNPLRGARHIKLPRCIQNSHSTVNIQNNDEFCFMYAMLAKFVTIHPERPTSYTDDLKRRYDWRGLEFPVALKDIHGFEEKNNLSINVFGLDTTFKKDEDNKTYPVFSIFPLKISDRELADHTDLLYIKTENTCHYVYIKDFNRLVKRQLTKCNNKINVCKRCFAHFDDSPNKLNLSGAERLEQHKRYCGNNNPLRLDLSTEKSVQFKNHHKSQRSRFCIYADFECSLHPFDTVQPNPYPEGDEQKKSFSYPTQLHVPYSYCYHIVDSQNEFTETRLYRGDNVAHHFMSSLKEDVFHIADILYKNRQMNPVLTPDEQRAFDACTDCYLCGKPFNGDKDPKVRDHSHAAPYTYRGAAHQSCNLKYQEQNTINCYFHNLSNYDAHFIIPQLNIDKGDIQVLANTEERYICFSKRMMYDGAKRNVLKLQFVDTFRFMSSSLATLVDNLPKDLLKETRKQFPDQHLFELISRKGVFPYDHITSSEVLNETALPPQSAFHNSLTSEDIKPEDYLHAQNVWTAFGIKTLGEYSDLYLKSDVLLLADVFQSFRDMCLREYNLDPAHYLTLPSYAWDVMLKLTGVSLDTFQDFDHQLFFERSIRGGICQVCTRHSKAYNKFCSDYDPKDPKAEQSQFIMYYDANNLYGWAMSQFIPRGNFKWLSADEIKKIKIPDLAADSDIGFMFEVDLSYPAELHPKHRSLPFCCENSVPPGGKFSKLMTTLNDKKNYIIHYRTLQQALENGLKIDRIHRVLSFEQSPWLKSYIDKNTALRKSARNEFEKDLFKLMNNAVFGRSMINARKFIDVRLVCDEKKFEKLVARSTFVDRTYYGDDLALIHLEKTKIVLDKPIFVGACILEISKWLMYDFHYNVMMKRYENRIDLLYTDTDSLIYSIKSDDIFAEMNTHLDDFDTSEYPSDNVCYSPTNAKTLGKFKDECKANIVKEFIGLLAKLYCVVVDDGNGGEKIIKRAKGVSKGVVKHELTVEDYRKCLKENTEKYTFNTRFLSKKHQVSTVLIHKRSLSSRDDKRYILPDGEHTLPWGHCDIPQE